MSFRTFSLVLLGGFVGISFAEDRDGRLPTGNGVTSGQIVKDPLERGETPQQVGEIFTIASIEDRFAVDSSRSYSILDRAEAEAAKIREAASAVRLKAYKEKLVEVTKKGDFDKAVAIKATIERLEKDPDFAIKEPKARKQKPKDLVKFGGHSYAFIKDVASWHIAQRKCEDMGGHLAIADTPQKTAFIFEFCKKHGSAAWVGATDEEAEGEWKWVNGKPAFFASPHVSKTSNGNENYMVFDLTLGDWNDVSSGRAFYICEWDR